MPRPGSRGGGGVNHAPLPIFGAIQYQLVKFDEMTEKVTDQRKSVGKFRPTN